MDTAVRDAYLRRLGVEPAPPTAEGLFALHRAHTERVPYETVWIHAGEKWDIDLSATVQRVALGGRGGYCFHLNGAFSELLGALGYRVTRHVGGVHGPGGPDGAELTNHLVLTVSGLPSEDNAEGIWYVDVGLGDALHEPLPLSAGTYVQGPFTLRLDATPGGVGDWHLTHDPAGSFTGMSWKSDRAEMDAFEERHRWLSTSEESGFVKVLSAQRREATGVDILRGLVRSRVGSGAMEHTIESKTEFVDTLDDVFLVNVRTIDAAAMERLWSDLCVHHEAWVEAGRP